MKHLSKKVAYLTGKFDKGGRYYLNDEFCTETSVRVRCPSRAWNLSVWKHVLTGKYLKSLSESQLKQIEALCAFNKIDMYEGV